MNEVAGMGAAEQLLAVAVKVTERRVIIWTPHVKSKQTTVIFNPENVKYRNNWGFSRCHKRKCDDANDTSSSSNRSYSVIQYMKTIFKWRVNFTKRQNSYENNLKHNMEHHQILCLSLHQRAIYWSSIIITAKLLLPPAPKQTASTHTSPIQRRLIFYKQASNKK